MEQTTTIEPLLWSIIGFAGSGVATFLLLGWLKGMHWEREMKMKRRHNYR
jgi:hypothetical protein